MTIEQEDQGWDTELVPRFGMELLLFYKDGEIRGQIQLNDPSEKEQWEKAIETLKQKSKS